MGIRRAMPRLSPSAMSAICCTAKAASAELREEKIAAAMAEEVREGRAVCGREAKAKLFGRFWMERKVGEGLVVVAIVSLGGATVDLAPIIIVAAAVTTVAAMEKGGEVMTIEDVKKG